MYTNILILDDTFDKLYIKKWYINLSRSKTENRTSNFAYPVLWSSRSTRSTWSDGPDKFGV